MPRPRRLALITATVGALLLSACGSNLDPADVRATDGGASTLASNQSPDVTAPGTVDPAEPGAPGAPADPAAGELPPGTTPDQPAGPGAAPGADPGAPVAPEDVAPENQPAGDSAAGSCDGFANQTGITDDTITLANASDISGPVPGLFQAAQDGAAAFVAYFNATDDLCGRKLKLLELDARSDAGGDQQAYATACDEAFGAIGSVSSQDQGGAATAAACGLPDVRSISTTPQRNACGGCFAAYSQATSMVPSSLANFWLKSEKEASQHVAILYVNVEAARVTAESYGRAYDKAGMNVDLVRGIDTGEFNFAPYVQEMKDKDIDFVQYFGPYQFALKLQQAMEQQNFEPAVYLEDPILYDKNYTDQAGSAAEGVNVYSVLQLFDDAKIPEMVLYRQWLDQVAPGSIPNYFGLFAWSAARLFVEEASKLGGRLSRSTLVSSLRKVRDWTSNGIHAPMPVGAKTTSRCIKIIQYNRGRWSQVSPGDFMCGDLINTGGG